MRYSKNVNRFETHKSTAHGKAQTLERKGIRATKYAGGTK
jgi:hypothetical protein